MKKFFLYYGLIAIIISLLFMNYCSYNCSKFLDNVVFEYEFRGVIIDKYIDYDNHAFKKITINVRHNQPFVIYAGSNFDSGLYDYVKKGDSIVKNKNSLTFTIIRGVKMKSFRFKCRE